MLLVRIQIHFTLITPPHPSVQPAGSWKVVIEASAGLLSPLTHALFLLCPAPHSWESQNTSWISRRLVFWKAAHEGGGVPLCPWSRLDWWWPVSSKWQGGRYKDWAGQVALPLQACVLALREKPLSRHQRREWHKPRCQILRRCQTVTLGGINDPLKHLMLQIHEMVKFPRYEVFICTHPATLSDMTQNLKGELGNILSTFSWILTSKCCQWVSLNLHVYFTTFFFQNQATFSSFSSCLLFEVWTHAGSVILAAVNGSSTTKVGKDRFFLV